MRSHGVGIVADYAESLSVVNDYAILLLKKRVKLTINLINDNDFADIDAKKERSDFRN